MISTSNQWGATVTKLNVPADWKGAYVFLDVLITYPFKVTDHLVSFLFSCRVADLLATPGTFLGLSSTVLYNLRKL